MSFSIFFNKSRIDLFLFFIHRSLLQVSFSVIGLFYRYLFIFIGLLCGSLFIILFADSYIAFHIHESLSIFIRLFSYLQASFHIDWPVFIFICLFYGSLFIFICTRELREFFNHGMRLHQKFSKVRSISIRHSEVSRELIFQNETFLNISELSSERTFEKQIIEEN